ncbi:MAG: divergent polysaccharide deacetylase family protein [Gammaproteobacteria bacterium]|nr:divergent polysaccharide deacetylase family protein [Gammaproteobacteria bacterium]MBU6509467.1 divergent polysaccharide deacetylase family protein [Gammaproteobacteria bacterium]MDE1983463.1 divergent polysaccharide deacetylase family protein [Gammaproteobacteria bacterium]MDE2108752.1 divergent polysaccharide deacetylase family protein [Gammaproteobacteria bacterium]MDE2461441.1 divergent polysaccharide deacetylase family protein [Gammaproteobacteria bacterium]
MRGAGLWLLLMLLVVAPAAAHAAPPVIAIIIDDLGNTFAEDRRAAQLPGPVACAILPHTEFAVTLADACHAAGKEVLLHLPMQALDDAPLGLGGISLDMSKEQIQNTVRGDLQSIPYVVGVNNHEGSLISMHPGDLAWIMQTLHAIGGLFFVDSYTTADSIAYQIAHEHAVPAARRDVFLDDVNTEAAVQFQFKRLLDIARHKGFALAIGHPRPATLAVLEAELPKLSVESVALVPVVTIVRLQQQHPIPWPESIYPLPAYSANLAH